MALWLKQSTAVEISVGPFVDATDGFTAETALTISVSDVRLKKNGANWAAKAEATDAVHEEFGHYRVLLDATDTNTLGILEIAISEGGARPISKQYQVVAANVYDSLFGGALLAVNVSTIANDAITAASIDTGAITADAIGDDAITAAAFAPDAIDANAISPTAVAEIQTDLATLAEIVTISGDIAAVQAVVDDVSTRLPAALVSGRMDSSVGAIVSTVANKIADHVLRRPYGSARASSDGDAVAFRSLLGAVGKLVNRWRIVGSTLTVYQEDDTTSTAPGGTQALTGTAGADPITEIDTV